MGTSGRRRRVAHFWRNRSAGSKRPEPTLSPMTATADPTRPLAGVRIVEISSFVAVPLAGMTLGQLGAEVVRVDPIGGAADYHRWPVTDDGTSIYWAGLNKGKRSVAADFRSPEGQDLVQRLIADSGVLITNVAGREWHSYDNLTRLRPDLIHVEVSGRADGGTGVDYTVNAGLGFPMVTGPAELATPGQPRAAGVGRRMRHLRGAGRRHRTAAPRRHRAGPADLHSAGERGAGDGGQPQPPHRGDGERHRTRTDRQLDLRPVRPGLHQQRRGLVHDRRAHAAPLPRPDRTHRDGQGRCRPCPDARRRLHRRGRAVPAPRCADRIVHRVVLRTYRCGDHRRAVRIIGSVGALPQLRRSGQRGSGDGQPDVHPAGPAPDRRIPGPGSARVDQRGLPAGGGRTGTRRRHRRGAGGVAGAQQRRDRPARRIRHRGNGFRRQAAR